MSSWLAELAMLMLGMPLVLTAGVAMLRFLAPKEETYVAHLMCLVMSQGLSTR